MMNTRQSVLAILTLALGIADAKSLRGLQQEEPIYAIPVEINGRRDPLLNGLNVPADAARVGMWGRLNRWPIVAVHSAVMPDGRIVTYGAMPDEQFQDGRSFVLWDPRLGFQEEAFEVVPNAQTVDSFCSSATLLSDGSFLVSGGAGEKIPATSRESSIFDWKTGESRRVEDMEMRRWYGTMTALPDGRALITGGGFPYATSGWQNPIGAASVTSSTPEVYTEGEGWRLLDGAFSLDAFGAENNRYWYPRQWVTPYGTIFGISTDKMWEMTLQGDGGIRTLGDFKTAPNATSLPNVGPTSTAVMYDQGKILQVGGNGYSNFDNSPSSAEATIFDITGINNGDIEVTEVDGMSNPRQWANAVVLPDGKVLVTGGTRFGNDGGSDAVLPAEIWDPVTKSWTVAASMAVYRGYHSSVALLPNGALLSTGGGIPGPVTHLNAEVFYPPYLFEEQDGVSIMAKRPSIVSISDNCLDYAQKVQVQVGSRDNVTQVSLIALPTNTHSFDSNQRRLVLTFHKITSGVEVTMPSRRNLAPPGYYYLSLVNAAGVPSNAAIVSLQSAPPPLPPVGLPEAPTPAPGPVFEPIRINTGGPLHVDMNFNVWQADEYFGGNGGAFCQLQGFTKPDGQIFGCERYYNKFVHDKPFAYEIPVDSEPAQYNVVLSFTEVFFQEPNKRVFDVFVNGAVIASELDIFEVAGYQTTYKVEAQPFVSNGNINITFVERIENPKISGIEITKISGQTLPTIAPTLEPTSKPTRFPTSGPTASPVFAPVTRAPTNAPVPSPTTNTPTVRPTSGPTAAPTSRPSPEPESITIQDIIEDTTTFSTLETAVEIAGLEDRFRSPGKLTLFAPTDAAFAALPQGPLAALLADPEALKDLLLYHVLNSQLPEPTLKLISPATISTLSGDNFKIDTVNNVVTVNADAKIVDADIFASNGVVHGIDSVLCNNNGFTCPVGTTPNTVCPQAEAVCACNNGGFVCPPGFDPTSACPLNFATGCVCNNGGFACPHGSLASNGCPKSIDDCVCGSSFSCPVGTVAAGFCPTGPGDCLCNNGGYACPAGFVPANDCPLSIADCECGGAFSCPTYFTPTTGCPLSIADCACAAVEPSTFTTRIGSCRTEAGSTGSNGQEYDLVGVDNQASCEQTCADQESCLAYEYSSSGGTCELWRVPSVANGAAGAVCNAKSGSSSGFTCPAGFSPTSSCPQNIDDCECDGSFTCPSQSKPNASCPTDFADCKCIDGHYKTNGSCVPIPTPGACSVKGFFTFRWTNTMPSGFTGMADGQNTGFLGGTYKYIANTPWGDNLWRTWRTGGFDFLFVAPDGTKGPVSFCLV